MIIVGYNRIKGKEYFGGGLAVAEKKTKTLAEHIAELKLNPEQVEFLSSYSKLRAARRFEQEALRLVGKPELIGDWIYAGYYDTGYFGGGRCSRGHTLRYVHTAKNKVTNEEVNFGIKCVTDFFNLNPTVLKLVQQGVAETSREIIESLEKLREFKTFEAYIKKTDIAFKYEQVKTKIPRNDSIQEMIRVGEMGAFLELKLPLPNWFEYRINNVFAREWAKKNNKWLKENPQYEELIINCKTLICDHKFQTEHANLWETINNIVNWMYEKQKLSPAQIGRLEKLAAIDYQEVDQLVAELKLLPDSVYKAQYEVGMVKDITKNYYDWGLTPKQVEVLRKTHKRYQTTIEQIQLGQLEEAAS